MRRDRKTLESVIFGNESRNCGKTRRMRPSYKCYSTDFSACRATR